MPLKHACLRRLEVDAMERYQERQLQLSHLDDIQGPIYYFLVRLWDLDPLNLIR